MTRIAVRLALALFAYLPFAALAFMTTVDPGETPALDANEGLLLVEVDTTQSLDEVRIEGRGSVATLLTYATLRNIERGTTARLYRVPAGTYRWYHVRSAAFLKYALEDDVEFQFEVKPGVVNYAGDLIFRPGAATEALVHTSNRGLRALDWLEKTHPALASRYALSYTGHFPDPFPAFYREQRTSAPKAAAARPAAPPPGELALPIDDLWRPSRVQGVTMNPAGDLVAETTLDGVAWNVDLLDLESSRVTRLLGVNAPIADVEWSGDRTLLISVGRRPGMRQVWVVRIAGDAQNRQFAKLEMPRLGDILDPLPLDPDHVLFSSVDDERLSVHKVDVSSQDAIDGPHFGYGKRLNRGVDDDVAWFADARGDLRAAIGLRDDKRWVYARAGDSFAPVAELPAKFLPLGLSAAANSLYGLSDEGRAQRDLVEFDFSKKAIARTAFSKPGVDVQAALFDAQRRFIGASYLLNGRVVNEYVDAAGQRLGAGLAKAFPDRSVVVYARSASGEQLIVGVDGSDQPEQIFHVDRARGQASVLDDTRPWLAGKRFAPSVVLSAKGADGLAIEGYLTLPPGAPGRVPLVVMPHGGPIGVGDTRRFDPDVQFVASLGVAVLQVNFRGSEGYGRAFREAGHKGLGTAIEDDIDAVLEAALAKHPIDASRICAMGFSYGGYSSLVSAVRWPKRYRCVASIFGVSDKALQFTASDTGRSEQGRKQLLEKWGDPHKEMARLQEYSPLYRYRELATPILLAHGHEDLRVDFEHTRRLDRLLTLAGRPPIVIEFPDEEHGVESPTNRRTLWNAIAGFLRQHLFAR